MSAMRIEGAALVVEQERLPVVTYPYEWTFGMLRQAAMRVLEVNALANEYGWELKDCHGFNVVFDGTQPLFVDLGSFVPRPQGARDWVAYEEFRRSYLYPLHIWKDGGGYIARRVLAASEMMREEDYGLYRWPWTRLDGGRRYARWVKLQDRWRRLQRMTDAYVRMHHPGLGGRLLCATKRMRWLPGRRVEILTLHAQVAAMRRRGGGGFWSNYQKGGEAFLNTPRFRRVAEIIAGLGVRSMLELAGNQGRLSSRLLEAEVVGRATCTDNDELAVDLGFERERATNGRLHTAVLDFVHPMVSPFGEPPSTRLQADVVLALAVTHHLLLTHRLPIERVFGAIGCNARRFVLVEFMPLGLWDGRRGDPVPPWYTLEWFRAAFVKQFELVLEERLEENRHLFCGEIRSDKAT